MPAGKCSQFLTHAITISHRAQTWVTSQARKCWIEIFLRRTSSHLRILRCQALHLCCKIAPRMHHRCSLPKRSRRRIRNPRRPHKEPRKPLPRAARLQKRMPKPPHALGSFLKTKIMMHLRRQTVASLKRQPLRIFMSLPRILPYTRRRRSVLVASFMAGDESQMKTAYRRTPRNVAQLKQREKVMPNRPMRLSGRRSLDHLLQCIY